MPSQSKPRKVGRPSLPKGVAKGGVLGLRLTHDERRKIAAKAKASGQTVSEWARSILIAAMEA
jgi:methyl coenzyme M reductase subunit D